MTRPNRYPYTRSQWGEEITIAHMSDNRTFKLRVERNQVTGETNQVITKAQKVLKVLK